MAARRPHTASPESAENYSTTCQLHCVVITESHQQTLRIPFLLWWCGGVNLRSGEIFSSSFRQFNTLLCAFIAGAGNCLSSGVSLLARLLCMLHCRGSSVDVRLSCCHAVLIWGETLALLPCPRCKTINPYLLPVSPSFLYACVSSPLLVLLVDGVILKARVGGGGGGGGGGLR